MQIRSAFPIEHDGSSGSSRPTGFRKARIGWNDSGTTGRLRMRVMRGLPVVAICRSRLFLIFEIWLDFSIKQKHDQGRPASARGAYALSSRHVRRGCDGREARVRRTRLSRTEKSCGPDTPKDTVKTVAQGMPGDPA